LVFFYSPRYRVPAIPVIVVLAAWTFAQAWPSRRHWPVPAAAVLAMAIAILLEPVNQHFDADRPSRRKALRNLAYALRAEHRSDDALATLRKCLAISPQDCESRVWLGETLAEANHHAEAVTEFRRALDEQPDDAALTIKLANSLLTLNRPKEAEPALAAAALREPNNPVLLAMLGNTKHLEGQNGAACEYFEKALQLAPGHVGILTDYAVALMNLQRWDAAKDQFRKVLAVDPNNFLAGYRLGAIAEQLGDDAEAQRCFERVLAAHPRNADVIYRVGCLELKQGRRDQALRLLHKALELNPHYRPAQDKLRELEPG
jgi:tetratricopeptide (TPR) repeat protein